MNSVHLLSKNKSEDIMITSWLLYKVNIFTLAISKRYETKMYRVNNLFTKSPESLDFIHMYTCKCEIYRSTVSTDISYC